MLGEVWRWLTGTQGSTMSDEWRAEQARRETVGRGVDAVCWKFPIDKVRNEDAYMNAWRLRQRPNDIEAWRKVG